MAMKWFGGKNSSVHSGDKYLREIKAAVGQDIRIKVDVYTVADAFGVTCQARFDAIKLLLCAGQRGHKSEEQDLREAYDAVGRAIQLHSQRESRGESRGAGLLNGRELSSGEAEEVFGAGTTG